MSFQDSCTIYCPPKNWSGYRSASSLWEDSRRDDTFVLDSIGARDGDGKGITYNVENGMDYSAGWTGGAMNLWLGEEGYDDLYVRMYLKYPIEWEWDAEMPHAPMEKIMRISTFNGNFFDHHDVAYYFGEPDNGGLNYPVWMPDWTYNYVWGYGYFISNARKAPDYDMTGTDAGQGFTSARLPIDYQWHSYEF